MEGEKKIIVVFRYDDYSSVSPIDVDGNLIATLAKNNLSCIFGVIPSVTTGEYRDPAPRECVLLSGVKAEMIRSGVRSGVVDIALHGYDHRTVSSGLLHSEFVGVDFLLQRNKLARGKSILEGICGSEVLVFIPPWNTYDVNTLRALEEVGIRCISANRYGPSDSRYSLAYLPITVELQGLRSALSEARNCADQSPMVVVLMHPYDFKESRDVRGRFDVGDLDRELAWVSRQPDVEVLSASSLLRSGDSIGPDRYGANAPFLLEDAAPNFIKRTQDRLLYLSLPEARRVKSTNQLRAIFFFLMSALMGGVLGYFGSLWGASFRVGPMPAATLICASLLVASITRIAMKRQVYFKGLLLFVLCAGFFIGYLVA